MELTEKNITRNFTSMNHNNTSPPLLVTPAAAAATNNTITNPTTTTTTTNNDNDASYYCSTVERMSATPTPPITQSTTPSTPPAPPGKRKRILPLLLTASHYQSSNHATDDDLTSSSTSSSTASICDAARPPNGIIRHTKLTLQVPPQLLKLSPGCAETPTPTPASSTSSTNASTTPSSALLTSASLSSSATPTPTTAKSLTLHAGAMHDQLLQWQDMPQYLQFNPYVLKGYRPLQTFKGCLLSLFYWHNETVNILTHAIPIFYILATVPGLMPWDKGYGFLSFCHLFGSVAPWCGSFMYHLFMNIENGENVYYTLLKMDMLGIWVSQSFGAMPLVTATTLCFRPFWKWVIIISYCLLSFWGLYKALTASSPWQRRLCFALPFTMRSILTFLRIRGLVGGSHMALSHVYLQDGVSILGGAIGAMRIPEKWFPGVMDFYLNSHNIMHVLVVVAVYSMHKATIKDFEWMSHQTCNNYNATDATIQPSNSPPVHDEL